MVRVVQRRSEVVLRGDRMGFPIIIVLSLGYADAQRSRSDYYDNPLHAAPSSSLALDHDRRLQATQPNSLSLCKRPSRCH